MSTDEYGWLRSKRGWNRQTGVCGVVAADINMRAPVTHPPYQSVFIRFHPFCLVVLLSAARVRVSVARPSRRFADRHPPHRCAGSSHALSDRSDRSDRSDGRSLCPSRPPPRLRRYRGHARVRAILGSKVVRSRVPPPEAAESRARAFPFQLSPVPRDKRFFYLHTTIRVPSTLEPFNL